MTERQAKVLNFIKAYMHRRGGISPNYPEICAGTGLKSRSRVFAALCSLERLGHITRVPRAARGIVLMPNVCPHCKKEIA